ncbi:hypothetical protein FOA52_014658 [Chlamydomonas sp. UWO 241]|nr:hypothetical protein FOA52_014658 [Chlamydomonas sp. UWO 241]
MAGARGYGVSGSRERYPEDVGMEREREAYALPNRTTPQGWDGLHMGDGGGYGRMEEGDLEDGHPQAEYQQAGGSREAAGGAGEWAHGSKAPELHGAPTARMEQQVRFGAAPTAAGGATAAAAWDQRPPSKRRHSAAAADLEGAAGARGCDRGTGATAAHGRYPAAHERGGPPLAAHDVYNRSAAVHPKVGGSGDRRGYHASYGPLPPQQHRAHFDLRGGSRAEWDAYAAAGGYAAAAGGYAAAGGFDADDWGREEEFEEYDEGAYYGRGPAHDAWGRPVTAGYGGDYGAAAYDAYGREVAGGGYYAQHAAEHLGPDDGFSPRGGAAWRQQQQGARVRGGGCSAAQQQQQHEWQHGGRDSGRGSGGARRAQQRYDGDNDGFDTYDADEGAAAGPSGAAAVAAAAAAVGGGDHRGGGGGGGERASGKWIAVQHLPFKSQAQVEALVSVLLDPFDIEVAAVKVRMRAGGVAGNGPLTPTALVLLADSNDIPKAAQVLSRVRIPGVGRASAPLPPAAPAVEPSPLRLQQAPGDNGQPADAGAGAHADAAPDGGGERRGAAGGGGGGGAGERRGAAGGGAERRGAAGAAEPPAAPAAAADAGDGGDGGGRGGGGRGRCDSAGAAARGGGGGARAAADAADALGPGTSDGARGGDAHRAHKARAGHGAQPHQHQHPDGAGGSDGGRNGGA